jgi:hypothetical protein
MLYVLWWQFLRFCSMCYPAVQLKCTTARWWRAHVVLKRPNALPENIFKFFFSLMQRPNSGLGCNFFLFPYHTELYTRPVRLLCISDQLVAETATHSKHDKHKRQTLVVIRTIGIPTCDPSNQTIADLLLRPHGHRYRLISIFTVKKNHTSELLRFCSYWNWVAIDMSTLERRWSF